MCHRSDIFAYILKKYLDFSYYFPVVCYWSYCVFTYLSILYCSLTLLMHLSVFYDPLRCPCAAISPAVGLIKE